MKNYKTIHPSKLKRDEIYSDIPFLSSKTTRLRYKGRKKDTLYFEYVDGRKCYGEDENHLIQFGLSRFFKIIN